MIKIVKYANENNSPEVYMSKMDPNKYYIVFDKERGHIYHPHKEQDYIALKRLCLKWEVSDWQDYSMSEEDLLNHPRFVLYCMDNVGDYVKIIEFLLKGPITIATNGTYVVELNQGELRTCRTYSSEIEPHTEKDCRKKCADNVSIPNRHEIEFCNAFGVEPRVITDAELYELLCYYNSRVELIKRILPLPSPDKNKENILGCLENLGNEDEEVVLDIRNYFEGK